MKNSIIKMETPELKAIEKSKAEKITATFEPMANMLIGFERLYNDIVAESEEGITNEVTNKAKRLRIDIGKIRIETGKLKDKQKEYIKLEDKAIMGVHNILVWAVKEKEDKLKSIENHFAIQEQKRLEKLQNDRAEILSEYVEDAYERNLAKFEEDEFQALLSQKKQAHEDAIAAEKQAEAERIAAEKINILDNQRRELAVPYYQFWTDEEKILNFGTISQDDFNKFMGRVKKAQQKEDERQAAIKAENEKLRREAAAREAKARAEAKAREAEAMAERKRAAKIEAELEAKAKKERERVAKIEAELNAKKEAERLAEAEAKEAKEKARAMDDESKYEDMIKRSVELLDEYEFKSKKYQATKLKLLNFYKEQLDNVEFSNRKAS